MATITEDLGEIPYNPSMYELLKTIDDPARLRALERRQLAQLADELSAYVLESVSKTGGHLSSHLGTCALTNYLARLLSGRMYASARRASEHLLKRVGVWELARRAEEHVKGMVTPSTLFEEFGFNYIGPIDGHDLDALVPTLANIKQLKGPQFLHVVTRKGQGYKLAEDDPIAYHGPGKFNPAEGLPKSVAARPTYSQVFGQWLCDMAEREPH